VSLLNPLNWFSSFINRFPVEVDKPQAAPAAAPAEQGTRTQRQDGRAGTAFGWLAAYPGAPELTPQVCRWMDADPALTMSRAAMTAPIRSADKSYEAREGTPDEVVKFIQSVFDPLLPEYVYEALDSPSMGWSGFEKVWGRRDGRWIIADLKPLDQVENSILVYKAGGDFAGIRTRGIDNQQLDLDPLYSFVCSCDARKRYYYGRPWHANAVATWWRKKCAFEELERLNKKASGIQPTGYYPPADDEAANHTNENKMREIVNAKMRGEGVLFPNLTGDLGADLAADYRNVKGLAETAMWRVEIEDFGNQAPAAESILNQIRMFNADLSRAWHVPERAVQEGQHGTKAEAGVHGDIALTVAELLYGDICTALNKGAVNDVLVKNYGEAARDSVQIKPGKLTDVWAGTDLALLNGLIANADTLMALVEVVDWDALLTRRGVPKVKGVIDLAKTLADKVTQKLAAAAKIAGQNPPTPRGGNGDTTALARANGEGGHIERLVRMLGEEG
jgi:hypothetical protein